MSVMRDQPAGLDHVIDLLVQFQLPGIAVEGLDHPGGKVDVDAADIQVGVGPRMARIDPDEGETVDGIASSLITNVDSAQVDVIYDVLIA